MVNKVTLIGNLGKDPEVRHLEGGAVVANFPVATSENYQDKSGNWVEQTEWHNIVAWRSLGERAEKSLKKGTMIYLEGKIKTRQWEDQNGQKRYTTEVVANYFRILNRRDNTDDGQQYSGNTTTSDMENSYSNSNSGTDFTTDDNDPAGDLPF